MEDKIHNACIDTNVTLGEKALVAVIKHLRGWHIPSTMTKQKWDLQKLVQDVQNSSVKLVYRAIVKFN